MSDQAMTPIDSTKTIRHRNFGRAGTQIWEATSKDGHFTYTRLEAAGTPWLVIDNSTNAEVVWPVSGTGEWFGSLTSARKATAKLTQFTEEK